MLLKKSKTDTKLIWPILLKTFIYDGFGITKGSKSDWVSEFNLLRDTITVDKCSYGNSVEFMDLFIYRGENFVETGKFIISIFQNKDKKIYVHPSKKWSC